MKGNLTAETCRDELGPCDAILRAPLIVHFDTWVKLG